MRRRAIMRRWGGRPAEVAVVLGANVAEDGTPTKALKRRIAAGVALYRAGMAERLLVTGGVVRGEPAEARVMRDIALSAGVPAEAILVEDRATTTLENARFSIPMIRARGWTRVLLVTDRFHLPRALMTFKMLGLACVAAPPRAGWPGWWWPYAALREAVAIPIYRRRIRRRRARRA